MITLIKLSREHLELDGPNPCDVDVPQAIPAELGRLVEQMMRRNPEHCVQSMAEVEHRISSNFRPFGQRLRSSAGDVFSLSA